MIWIQGVLGQLIGEAKRPGLAALLLAVTAQIAHAQSPTQPPPPEHEKSEASSGAPTALDGDKADQAGSTSIFPHPESDRYWISGQANFIFQAHPSFHAPYSGTNSLEAGGEHATSRVLTLFTGLRLNRSSEMLFDVEETGGRGLSEGLGLGGFTDLDVVRTPTLSKAPYVARLMWHQVIPLSPERVMVERGPFSAFNEIPARRLEIRFGKLSMADFFDLNSYGSDSHQQFMNWTVDNNGAYDYSADTRGYTVGGMLEYHDRKWTVRFAEGLMPKVANGTHLDANLGRAHAENIEFELHASLLPGRQGVLRLLSFVNHANMGSYREAVDNFLEGLTPTPDITAHPLRTTIKYGFGVNIEQPLNDWIGVFGRWGWNEGRHESYAYTEVDQTVLIGLGGNGRPWRRKLDRVGVAVVTNAISRDHQRYLALGGLGFLLGDGRLDYGRESIVESYYTLHLWRGIYPSFGLQYINNPGYNRDRGPVLVPSLRLHLEF